MRLAHIKGKLPLLLLLLTPSVLMAIGLLWFNTVTLNRLETRSQQAQAAAEHSLRDLAQLNQMSSGMLSVHRQVTSVLEEASNGRLSEARAYAIHTRLVDEMATMAPLESWLGRESAEHSDWRHQETTLALKNFQAYREHVLMATDIVAIDPSQAKRYVNTAFDRYLDFAGRHQRLATRISSENSTLLEKLATDRSEYLQNAWWATLGGLLALNLLWLGVASWLARNLAVLTEAMRHLSAQPTKTQPEAFGDSSALHDDEFPTLDMAQRPDLLAMEQSRMQLVRDMARAVLAFDRHARSGLAEKPRWGLPAVQPALRKAGRCAPGLPGGSYRRGVFPGAGGSVQGKRHPRSACPQPHCQRRVADLCLRRPPRAGGNHQNPPVRRTGRADWCAGRGTRHHRCACRRTGVPRKPGADDGHF